MVARTVVLDSGPLGLMTNPRPSSATRQCQLWLDSLLKARVAVLIPEIADYEVRRELIRARRRKAIHRLDNLTRQLYYMPITTSVMQRAAELWAQARNAGQATASDDAIDGDMIFVAQAEFAGTSDLVIATSNIAHIGRFFTADLWSNITVAPQAP